MRDFLNDFYDDLFALGFGKPRNIVFNSGKTQDMNPVYWTEIENGYRAVCRTVGINPEDVSVEIKNGYIKVSGKTKYEETDYDVSYDLPVSGDVLSNIEKLEYKTINGLTYIYIYIVRPEKKKVKIERIK